MAELVAKERKLESRRAWSQRVPFTGHAWGQETDHSFLQSPVPLGAESLQGY